MDTKFSLKKLHFYLTNLTLFCYIYDHFSHSLEPYFDLATLFVNQDKLFAKSKLLLHSSTYSHNASLRKQCLKKQNQSIMSLKTSVATSSNFPTSQWDSISNVSSDTSSYSLHIEGEALATCVGGSTLQIDKPIKKADIEREWYNMCLCRDFLSLVCPITYIHWLLNVCSITSVLYLHYWQNNNFIPCSNHQFTFYNYVQQIQSYKINTVHDSTLLYVCMYVYIFLHTI